MPDGLVEIFLGHGDQAFGHAQMQVVEQGQGGAGIFWEARQQALDELWAFKPDIHPLRQVS